MKKLLAIFFDIVETLVVAASVFVVVYVFLLQPHQVVGSSMFPNFHDKEYILTDKISYCFALPKRGEIVVFKSPEDSEKDFIKRVIALPNETIKIEHGKVFVNGTALPEDYLDPDIITPPGKFLNEGTEVKVPANSYAVFGDNRLNSSDSRTWGFIEASRACGFFGTSSIIGKAILVYWPPKQAKLVPQARYR
ncbi:signal peptidase I [Candidatus Microgenomates bacterium]|nr:signal peptidase I [Candidatus Microgenomates bacterium]